MNWIKIFGPEILQKDDFVTGVTAEGKKLCVVKDGDKIYATQFYCPHAGAALPHGTCKAGKLICPYHRYEYDLESGRGASGQGDYIDLYPTEVREDGVYVCLPQPGFLKRMLGI